MAIDIPDSPLGSEAPRPQAGASRHCNIILYCAPLAPAYKAGLAGNVPVKCEGSLECILPLSIRKRNCVLQLLLHPLLKTQRNLR